MPKSVPVTHSISTMLGVNKYDVAPKQKSQRNRWCFSKQEATQRFHTGSNATRRSKAAGSLSSSTVHSDATIGNMSWCDSFLACCLDYGMLLSIASVRVLVLHTVTLCIVLLHTVWFDFSKVGRCRRFNHKLPAAIAKSEHCFCHCDCLRCILHRDISLKKRKSTQFHLRRHGESRRTQAFMKC